MYQGHTLHEFLRSDNKLLDTCRPIPVPLVSSVIRLIEMIAKYILSYRHPFLLCLVFFVVVVDLVLPVHMFIHIIYLIVDMIAPLPVK